MLNISSSIYNNYVNRHGMKKQIQGSDDLWEGVSELDKRKDYVGTSETI